MKIKIFKSKSLNSFLEYSFKRKWVMIGVLILSSLASAAAAAPAWLSKNLLDAFTKGDLKVVRYMLILYVASVIVKVISTYLSVITSSYVTETVKREIRVDVFKHLQSLPLSYYKKNKLGDIMARLSGDASALGQIAFTLFDIFKESIMVAALTFRMFQVDWKLSLVSITVVPIFMKVVRKLTKRIRESGRIRQDTSGLVTAFMQEALSGIHVIKAFNKKNKMVEKYKEITLDEFKKAFRSRKITARVSPITEIVSTTMIALVVLYTSYSIAKGKMTFGDLGSFIAAIGLMQQPLKRLMDKYSGLQEQMPSADRVIEIMDEKPEINFHSQAKTPIFDNVDTVEFDNVCFSYEADKENLKNINLKVNKGEVVAFVGKSGSGKTTLVNLIPRFYETSSGAIKINNHDIKEYSLGEYRNHIGIVPQETFLFSGTIGENISFWKEGVTQDDIVNAAKMANAYEFIKDLPKGFDTEVGERGVLLSGGQKQRIAIARTIIQNPQIMILDEATSALDTESERLVQEALDKLMKNRTTFVIAHRLSTIVKADKIVVMNDGVIKEAGSHEELLKKNGIYKNLYDIQFKTTKEEENVE